MKVSRNRSAFIRQHVRTWLHGDTGLAETARNTFPVLFGLAKGSYPPLWKPLPRENFKREEIGKLRLLRAWSEKVSGWFLCCHLLCGLPLSPACLALVRERLCAHNLPDTQNSWWLSRRFMMFANFQRPDKKAARTKWKINEQVRTTNEKAAAE